MSKKVKKSSPKGTKSILAGSIGIIGPPPVGSEKMHDLLLNTGIRFGETNPDGTPPLSEEGQPKRTVVPVALLGVAAEILASREESDD